MPRTGNEWRAQLEGLLARLRPGFERAGAPLSPTLQVASGAAFPVFYDETAETLRLGFPLDLDGDEEQTRAVYADLLSSEGADELDRMLELLFVRLGVEAVARHLRCRAKTATGDEWLETQVAQTVAHAVTAQLFGPHADFLGYVLRRAEAGLGERRMLALAGDAATSPLGTFLHRAISGWIADLERTDRPSLEEIVATLVGGTNRAQRRGAESELALLQTLADGPPALRRTAAELFADEATPEAIARLLVSGRKLAHDVRLMLAAALKARGGREAEGHLSSLATAMTTPPPVAAAAALLLEDPASADVAPGPMLSELEDAGLTDALKLVRALTTPAGVQAVWPALSHASPAVRREAYRLLSGMLPEGDAWSGITDPEPEIRAASVSMLSPRPGLARTLSGLLLDEHRSVRAASLLRVRRDPMLANDVGSVLSARETDDARLALAAVLAERHPELADELFGRVMARIVRPYVSAHAAASALRANAQGDRHLQLVESLAHDALDRKQRDLIEFAASARGRSDWLELFEATEADVGTESEEGAFSLEHLLPEGWYHALHTAPEESDPRAALRTFAVSHPEPFVRAALLLWLARSGEVDVASLAALADQDPTTTVADVARVLRGEGDPTMSLTAIEKALFLRTVPLFRSVPTPNLLALAGAMVATNHAPGDAIVRQGALGDRLHVLFEGHAQAQKEQASGTPQALATLGPGAVFGEMSLFDSEPRSASVVATEPCRTLTLDGQTFHRLALQHPEILWEVCRVLTQRMRTLGQGMRTAPRAPAPAPTRPPARTA